MSDKDTIRNQKLRVKDIMVSQRDLFRPALAAALGYGDKARKAMLKTVSVKEVMSEPVVTISPDETVREAARMMVEGKIGCLPVVEDSKLVGLVSETDILRYAMTC